VLGLIFGREGREGGRDEGGEVTRKKEAQRIISVAVDMKI
jgi:hypothetical protein